jgi:hypothetical protein
MIRHCAYVLLLIAMLSGCSWRKHPATVAAAPPPKPAATAEPEPPPTPIPEAPLSIAQTNVQLPAPQPISAEALASIPQPEPAAPARHTRSRPPATAPAKPETAVESPPPPPAEDPARIRLQPMVSAEERLKIKEEVESRQREVNDRLVRIRKRGLTAQEKNTVSRIQSFLNLSAQALNRGDMRQANSLSERALLLARDLESGR